jgi:hypothetical protein
MNRGLPSVIFTSPDASSEIPSSLMHEITHVWQNLQWDRFTNRLPIADTYNPKPGNNFQSYGPESQAVLTSEGDKSATSFISSNRVRAANPADLAFLDSVRAAYGNKSGLGDDTDARFGTMRKGAFRGVQNGELMADAAPDKQPIDYAALARQAGAISSTVDYSALAKQAGAISSQAAPSTDVISAQPKPGTMAWAKQKFYQAVDATANALPAAGATIGAVLGAPEGGPIGAVGGAGIGGMAGAAGRQILRRSVGFESPATGNQAAQDIAKQGAIQGTIQGATEGLGRLAPGLKNMAVGQYQRALSPTTKVNKAIAEKIAPQMVKRGLHGNLDALAEQAGDQATALRPQLDAAYQAMPSTATAGAGPKIVNALEQLKAKYVVNGMPAQPAAVNAISGVQDIVKQYGSDISPNSLRQLKQVFDEPVAAKGGFAGADLSTQYGIRAQKAAANSIRSILNEASPDVAALNKEMSFWLDVQRVTKASAMRKTGQEGGLLKTFTPLASALAGAGGVAVGHSTIGLGVAAGTAVTSFAAQAMRSPGWRTLSAVAKNQFADALARGDVGQAAAVLGRFGLAVGESQQTSTQNGPPTR